MRKKVFRIRVAIIIIACVLMVFMGLFIRNMIIMKEKNKIEQLKEKNFQWFVLNSDDGLTVCVWQYEGGSIQCGLLSGMLSEYDKDKYSTRERLEMGLGEGVSPEDMKLILSTYKIPQEKISVISWGSPCSSRTVTLITNDQIKDVEKRIFSS